jgi:hypothetical protein
MRRSPSVTANLALRADRHLGAAVGRAVRCGVPKLGPKLRMGRFTGGTEFWHPTGRASNHTSANKFRTTRYTNVQSKPPLLDRPQEAGT